MKAIINIGRSFGRDSYVSENGDLDEDGFEEYRRALEAYIDVHVDNASIINVPGYGLYVSVETERRDGLEHESDEYIDIVKSGFAEYIIQVVLSF